MLVPSTLPLRPCDSLPISFPMALPHMMQYLSRVMSFLYSNTSPLESITAPAISHNNFIGNRLAASICGVTVVLEILMADGSASCVAVRENPLERVFAAGVYDCVGLDV